MSVITFAHRGGMAHAPENTLAAFRKGVALGAGGLESDVWLCADGQPVLIHDDQFRFEVNLVTGTEAGKVYLFNHIAGPKVRCTLNVVGTGFNPDGNPTFDYTGTCTFRGR